MGPDRVGVLPGAVQAGARTLETGILGVGSARTPMGFEVDVGAILAGASIEGGADKLRSENNVRCSIAFGVGLTIGVEPGAIV